MGNMLQKELYYDNFITLLVKGFCITFMIQIHSFKALYACFYHRKLCVRRNPQEREKSWLWVGLDGVGAGLYIIARILIVFHVRTSEKLKI
jgi:hypothetical protein